MRNSMDSQGGGGGFWWPGDPKPGQGRVLRLRPTPAAPGVRTGFALPQPVLRRPGNDELGLFVPRSGTTSAPPTIPTRLRLGSPGSRFEPPCRRLRLGRIASRTSRRKGLPSFRSISAIHRNGSNSRRSASLRRAFHTRRWTGPPSARRRAPSLVPSRTLSGPTTRRVAIRPDLDHRRLLAVRESRPLRSLLERPPPTSQPGGRSKLTSCRPKPDPRPPPPQPKRPSNWAGCFGPRDPLCHTVPPAVSGGKPAVSQADRPRHRAGACSNSRRSTRARQALRGPTTCGKLLPRFRAPAINLPTSPSGNGGSARLSAFPPGLLLPTHILSNKSSPLPPCHNRPTWAATVKKPARSSWKTLALFPDGRVPSAAWCSATNGLLFPACEDGELFSRSSTPAPSTWRWATTLAVRVKEVGAGLPPHGVLYGRRLRRLP